MASTPQWMKWYSIHGHNGCNGQERIPHVHVKVGDGEASVCISDGRYLKGEANIPHNRRSDVQDWVRSNSYSLQSEWDSKSNPQGNS